MDGDREALSFLNSYISIRFVVARSPFGWLASQPLRIDRGRRSLVLNGCCKRSVEEQSKTAAALRAPLDCFAPLAMTKAEHRAR